MYWEITKIFVTQQKAFWPITCFLLLSGLIIGLWLGIKFGKSNWYKDFLKSFLAEENERLKKELEETKKRIEEFKKEVREETQRETEYKLKRWADELERKDKDLERKKILLDTEEFNLKALEADFKEKKDKYLQKIRNLEAKNFKLQEKSTARKNTLKRVYKVLLEDNIGFAKKLMRRAKKEKIF